MTENQYQEGTGEKVILSEEGSKRVAEALERPPAPNEALVDAAKRFKQEGGFYKEKTKLTK